MSFDVFLQRFVGGETADAPRPAVMAVLSSRDHTGPDAFGFYTVTFSDGTDVELGAKGLETADAFSGCAFHIHGLGDEVVRFIFEIAQAGAMAIMPAMEDGGTLLVPGVRAEDLPVDFPAALRAIPIGSAQDLGGILRQGFAGWSRYRDQIVESGPGRNNSSR